MVLLRNWNGADWIIEHFFMHVYSLFNCYCYMHYCILFCYYVFDVKHNKNIFIKTIVNLRKISWNYYKNTIVNLVACKVYLQHWRLELVGDCNTQFAELDNYSLSNFLFLLH